MDVEDFESLLSLDPNSIYQTLAEKEADFETVREDFHHFLLSTSKRTGIVLRNSLLKRTSDTFFDSIHIKNQSGEAHENPDVK